MDWFDSEAKPWGGKVGSKPKCFWNHLPWRITGCRLCPLHIFCPFFPGCWFHPGWQLTTLRLPALPVPVLPILPLGGNLLGHRLSLLSGMDGNHQGHPEHRLRELRQPLPSKNIKKIETRWESHVWRVGGLSHPGCDQWAPWYRQIWQIGYFGTLERRPNEGWTDGSLDESDQGTSELCGTTDWFDSGAWDPWGRPGAGP